jgi:phosphonate transport system substrate-binding protein
MLYSDSLFLNSNSEAPKVSSVILPVFFGKTDAAVVKRYGWETMKEMNPQLAVQLQILTNSISLPDAVICLTQDTREHPFRDDLIRGTAELHADPQGQQILLLFKTDKMVPFQPQHLDGVRDIIAKSGGPAPSPERKAAVTASGGEPKS